MEDILIMLNKILVDLKQMGGINASSITSRNGLLIVSDIEMESHAKTFAAMSATMLAASETATIELGKGIPDRVIVESDQGKLVVMGAGPDALLVILTEPDAGLGLILVELEKTAEKIKRSFDTSNVSFFIRNEAEDSFLAAKQQGGIVQHAESIL